MMEKSPISRGLKRSVFLIFAFALFSAAPAKAEKIKCYKHRPVMLDQNGRVVMGGDGNPVTSGEGEDARCIAQEEEDKKTAEEAKREKELKDKDIRDIIDLVRTVESQSKWTAEAASQCYAVQVANSSDGGFQISDSLVKDLSCSKLSSDNVLLSLQPDAFSVEKQWPVQNWGANGLGQCWALALSQRQMFFLARFGVKDAGNPRTNGTRDQAMNMIKDGDNSRVIQVSDSGMGDYYRSSDFYNSLREDKGGNNFRSAVESRQIGRFYSPGNLGMVFGGRERSESANEDTMKDILKDMSKGRMPLLILRAALTAQHAILIKKVEKLGENHYRFTCYDSNQPGREATMEYKDRQFYAPNIVGLFDYNARAPVGVFLKDDDEMDDIQETVYKYYSELCKGIKKIDAEVNK